MYVEIGDVQSARLIEEALSKVLQPQSRAYATLINGVIALRDGDTVTAIDSISAGIELADLWLLRFYRGIAYLGAGYGAEALDEFTACYERRGEASAVFLDDLPTYRYAATLPYWKGRAQQAIGMAHDARQSFMTFIAARPEGDALAEDAVQRIMNFLREKDIVTVDSTMEPALRAHMGSFIPQDERHFFWITAHYDPAPLFTHFWHWFELARMDTQPHPSPIRQGALLYNIFDSRNEGTATGVEEMFMHAGLYDDSPRSRELVWILLAQRAARGLGSLYAHANEMTMEEAGQVHMDWTPRGWMKTEPDLMIFEQHLYLRQPGYGTSYVTGKYLLERTLADYARQLEERGEAFSLRAFFDALNATDSIPIALSRWEMTGLDDEVRALWAREPMPD